MRMHMYSYAYLCNTILSHPCCASSQSAQPCAHHDREGFMYLRSVLFSLCLVIAVPASAQKVETADVAQVKEILKRSVGFRTVEGQGRVPAYAAYLASVLKEGGFADSEITITPLGEIGRATSELQ